MIKHYHAASQALAIDLWAALAERYADEPTLIGYDLLNEPIATHFDRQTFNPKLEPLFKEERQYREAAAYLESFFDILADDRKFQREILDYMRE